MSVGIYMPAYNVEKYIVESIKSIEEQTYKDWQLVILDDGSTDNTVKVVNEYIKNNDKIALYEYGSHCGRIGHLKNTAISKLDERHEFICHVGSDDKIPNYSLEKLIEFMNDNPDAGVACSTFVCFDDEDNTWMYPHVANAGPFDRKTLLQFMNGFALRFYRWEWVKKAGGYSDELTSAVDYDLMLRLDEITTIKRMISPVAYYYRQHRGQVSTHSRKKQDLNAKTALENALKRRNINAEVLNDGPPFKIKYNVSHFIWGKK